MRPTARLQLGRTDSRNHAVERLPVEIDEPENIPEATRQGVRESLPDVSFVELGVTEQRDEATPRRGTEARLEAERSCRRLVARDQQDTYESSNLGGRELLASDLGVEEQAHERPAAGGDKLIDVFRPGYSNL